MARKRKAVHPSSNPTNRAPLPEPPALPIVKFGEFKLTTNSGTTRAPTPPTQGTSTGEDVDDGGGWEPAGKRQKKSKPEKRKNVPEMVLSPQRLKTPVKVTDLQGLMLWLVADGTAPQWLLVKVCYCSLYVVGVLYGYGADNGG